MSQQTFPLGGGGSGGGGSSINWRGAWASGTTYAANDAVSRNGSSYISLAGGNVGNDPATDGGVHWGLLAQAGNVAARQTATITTASLAAGATENLTVTLAKSFALGKVVVSGPARIRLYSTAAARTNDASRAATTAVPYGTQHGIITDLVLDTNDKWTWIMSPLAYGANEEAVPSTSISYAITNIGTSTAAITVTFTFTSEES